MSPPEERRFARALGKALFGRLPIVLYVERAKARTAKTLYFAQEEKMRE